MAFVWNPCTCGRRLLPSSPAAPATQTGCGSVSVAGVSRAELVRWRVRGSSTCACRVLAGVGLLCSTSVAVCGPGSSSGKRAVVSSLAAELGSAVPRVALHSGLRRPVSGARALGGALRAGRVGGRLPGPGSWPLDASQSCPSSGGVSRAGRCSWPVAVASHPACTPLVFSDPGVPTEVSGNLLNVGPSVLLFCSRIPAASTSLNASLFFLSQPVHQTPPGSPLSGPRCENVHRPNPRQKLDF